MKKLVLCLIAAGGLALASGALAGHHEKGENPCNPCASNPCNPCASNPCNPCAEKNPCNPCNPCAEKKNPCSPQSAPPTDY